MRYSHPEYVRISNPHTKTVNRKIICISCEALWNSKPKADCEFPEHLQRYLKTKEMVKKVRKNRRHGLQPDIMRIPMISWQEITGMRLVCASCGKPPDTTPGEECAEPLHWQWYSRRLKTKQKHNARNYFGKVVSLKTQDSEIKGLLMGYSNFNKSSAKLLIISESNEEIELETREILQLTVV